MHLFFITRGMKWHRDKFVDTLKSLVVPWTVKYKDKKGKIKESVQAVETRLSPVELWDLVIPEENLDKMLTSLRPMNQIGIDSAKCPSPKLKWGLAGLRKLLKLKPVPAFKEGKHFPVYSEHVAVSMIGMKEDYKDELGNECL